MRFNLKRVFFWLHLSLAILLSLMGHLPLAVVLSALGVYLFYDRSELEVLWSPPLPGTREYEQFQRDPPDVYVLAWMFPAVLQVIGMVGVSIYRQENPFEYSDTDVTVAAIGFTLLLIAIIFRLKERAQRWLRRSEPGSAEGENDAS